MILKLSSNDAGGSGQAASSLRRAKTRGLSHSWWFRYCSCHRGRLHIFKWGRVFILLVMAMWIGKLDAVSRASWWWRQTLKYFFSNILFVKNSKGILRNQIRCRSQLASNRSSHNSLMKDESMKFFDLKAHGLVGTMVRFRWMEPKIIKSLNISVSLPCLTAYLFSSGSCKGWWSWSFQVWLRSSGPRC